MTKLTVYKASIMKALLALLPLLAISIVTVSAQAELVISEPNQTKKVGSLIASDEVNNSAIINQASFSQSPSEVSIIKLMQVMRIDEQITSLVNGQQLAVDIIDAQADKAQQADNKNLNKRQRELQTQIQAILGQYAEIMGDTIGEATDVQTLTQAYIRSAREYYTQAEVNAQIEFYDTAIGQSILDKQPQVSAAFLKQSLPKNINDSKDKLADLLPQMQQIIKGIF